MKVNNKRSLWQTFVHRFKGTALVAGMIAMGLSGTPLQAVSIDLEGCRNSDTNGYTLSSLTDADGIGLYQCDDNAFTDGNMKNWAELDRVPHRIIINSGGKVGDDPITFSYTVSGHFQGDDPATGNPDKRGWNQITGLVLVEELSDNACKDIQANVTQVQAIKYPGVEGAYSTVYRKVTVVGMPPKTRCVALFNAELALGAHYYTGATLHFYLLNGDLEDAGGKKTVQVSAEGLNQELEKTMSATQDRSHTWTVGKTTDDIGVHFDNTCAEPDNAFPLEREVTIKVTWEREEATADGNVNVTTKIYATNNASRDLTVDVNDTIYDGDTKLGETIVFDRQILVPGTHLVGTHSIVVDDTSNLQLRDEAFITYVIDQPFAAPLVIKAVKDALVEPSGNTKNATATIKDHEWLADSPQNTLYSAEESTEPTNVGEFDLPYAAGNKVDGDINWTALDQTGSGSATFTKTIYLSEPTITTGSLKDRASLVGSDGFTQASNLITIGIDSTATVELTIDKTIPDILQGSETAVFTFTVSNDTQSQNVEIEFAAGETEKSKTVSGLAPGIYSVQEQATPGFNPQINPIENIVLTLPTCSETVEFVNELSGSPKVRVGKVTHPATIDGIPQDGGWEMALYHKPLGSTEWNIEPMSTLPTEAGSGSQVFSTPEPLPEGDYRIVETMQDGWFNMEDSPTMDGLPTPTDECVFDIEYPEDYNRPDIVCSFTNAKYAKIIVDKVTKLSGDPQLFDFEMVHGADTVNFLLADDTSPYDSGDLMAGTYYVTEADPRPDFDLESITCVETGVDGLNMTGPTDLTKLEATIILDWGETVECTYTNKKRGEIEVIKYENGDNPPLSTWYFTLSGPGLDPSGVNPAVLEDNTISVPLNFGGAKLIPGEEYTLCETGVSATWTTTWAIEGGTQVGDPYNPAMPVYVPLLEVSNEDLCIDFTASSEADFKVTITVNNDSPDGEPRTIGYWKNWNTCTNGGQAGTAADNGGFAAGFWLLNDVLSVPPMEPMMLGDLWINNCVDGVAILNKTDIARKSKKRASDAAYGMAAQLLAAKANYAAGAETCLLATTAIEDANELLVTIKFNGLGGYLAPKDAKKSPQAEQRRLANELAGTLDEYNNGNLCP